MAREDHEKKTRPRNAVSKFYVAIIVLSWPAFVLGEFLFPLWLVLVGLLIFESRKAALLTFFLSSFTIISILSVANATFGYFSGTARLLGIGLMMGRSNLDPEYRCFHGSIGCTGTGYFWTALPNNLTIYALASFLGPVRGTYHGPYPLEMQAWYIVNDNGVTVNREQLSSGNIPPINGTEVNFAESRLMPWLPRNPERYKMAMFEDRCLLLMVEDEDSNSLLYMIDNETGEYFAQYYKVD